ncbi:hypothetical protein LWI29_036505 [Acer saccharum]|uniref:Chromo domain-containing protein n=1 Tax=Acer saccharum TaxID=4024 RepID=A0AA39RG41_ACESA|nr:hypothetical protein LWI29_036505 [Acer saccharum]
MDDLMRYNEADPWIQQKMKDVASMANRNVTATQVSSADNHLHKFHIDNGLLKFQSRIVLSPSSAWITKVFQAHHSSPSSGHTGGQVTPTLILPQVTEKGLIDKDEPIAIIGRKMVKRGNVVRVDVLVHWKHHSEEDATWENYYDLKARFPDLMAKFDAACPAP